MLWIVFWIITSFLTSTADSFRKIAVVESKMTTQLFNLTACIFSAFFILFLFLYFGISEWLMNDYAVLFLVFSIILVNTFISFLCIKVYKEEKLSNLLPYDSLDKVFIVIFWFIIYFWTPNETSITTLFITLAAIVLIFFMSTDIKNISFPHTIKLFAFYKFMKAIITLSTGYILLSYTWIDFVILEWVFWFLIAIIIVLLLKQKPREALLQSKIFYKNRTIATLLWRSGYVLWLYIIQSSWVIIATLLWFFTIAFNVLSMKYIVKDNPTKKQVLLAVTVLVMIGIGYYFK